MKKIFIALLLSQISWGLVLAQKFPLVYFAQRTVLLPENATDSLVVSPLQGEPVGGFYFRMFQFWRLLAPAEQQSLRDAGIIPLGYYPSFAYLVAIPESFDMEQLRVLPFRSVAPIKGAWKMALNIFERPYADWVRHGDALDIQLQIYPVYSISDGAAWCRERGLTVLKEGVSNGILQLRIPLSRVQEVAELPFVQYMELAPGPGKPDDIRGRAYDRANLLDSDGILGKKYNGAGVKVLVRDDGQLGPHIDIQGRLRNYAVIDPATYSHGDGVVGIIGGTGNLDPLKRGAVPGALMYAVDYVPDFQDLTLPLYLNEGVTITNTSYSEDCNLGYNLNAQTVDRQLFDHPYLMHVFSSGNDNGMTDCGYGAGNQWGNITGGHKMAKNAITVANVFADGTIQASSSRGPASDGRLKPDISTNGQGQSSLKPNNSYQVFGGTSAAAPMLAGCMAQLTHAYRDLYGVADAPSALLKATMLNTAVDLGNKGPDFKHGWGQLNTWKAYQLLEQHQWTENTVQQGQDWSYTLLVPPGVKEAKVMLYWVDPPAMPNNTLALVNDLDITVKASNGATFLPWKLDPSPNPVILDTPAGKGRDSLNNVEQVSMENPVPDAYTVHIKGKAVPMGPQSFYLVWEFVTGDIKLTYPNGGEALAPGETERIYWDAYGDTESFDLTYSTDGGQSYQPVASVAGHLRYYDWTVPTVLSGKVRVKVTRGIKNDESDEDLSIAKVPGGLVVSKICPDSTWLSWNEVNDTLSYQVYLLGEKYMELAGVAQTNTFALPSGDVLEKKWLSVNTWHPSGIRSRRAVAVSTPQNLVNCPQQQDISVQKILNPAAGNIIACNAINGTLSVQVRNNGQLEAGSALVLYQLENNAAVSESLPNIPVGATVDFTFQTPLQWSSTGTQQLKVWVQLPGDHAAFNDTLTAEYQVSTMPLVQLPTEDFETSADLPLGWAAINPDQAKGWAPTDVVAFPTLVGADGQAGRAWFVDMLQYGPVGVGQSDYLYLPPLDLSNFTQPSLAFDVAHAPYSALYIDSLRVEIYPACDVAQQPLTIWGKGGSNLATEPSTDRFFVPGSAAAWRRELIDLKPYVGQQVIIRFVSVNGYGNNIFIDNIGISDEGPLAQFDAPGIVCKLDTVTFQAAPSPGNSTYNWNFGVGANPGTATGEGPHEVFYFTAGTKIVRLVVNNELGADTTIKNLTVRNPANAAFSTTQDGLTVSFLNSSTNADSYGWSFGDGAFSTESDPVHTYATAGTYTVVLLALNSCSSDQATTTVGVVSTFAAGEQDILFRVLPNPTHGDFRLECVVPAPVDMELSLSDALGRSIVRQKHSFRQGVNQVAFEQLGLAAGIYQLKAVNGQQQFVFSIVVQ